MLKQFGLAAVATFLLINPAMAQQTSFDLSGFGPAPAPITFNTPSNSSVNLPIPGMFRGDAVNSTAVMGDVGIMHDNGPTGLQAIQINQPARMTTNNQTSAIEGLGGAVAPIRTGTMGLAPVFGYGGGSQGLQSPGGYDPLIRLPFGLGGFRPPTNIGLPGGGQISLPPINSNTQFPFP